ncbi:MFS multidrug transporter [Aspergillus sp. HF37]|nr:MFS multidrug transporter [Aspergillus sp. HF37]
MSTSDDHESRSTLDADTAATGGFAEGKYSVTDKRSSHENESADAVKDVEQDAGNDMEKGAPARDKDDALDPNIIGWDGPDDPVNPRNWSKGYKLTNVILVSFALLYTNLATTIFAPAANVMQREFGIQNDSVKVLTITIASLGFALGQLFVPPLSEVFGRVPVYRVCSIVYLGFTAGCSRSTNVTEFLVFRLCTGLAAASYMSTGGGTIADLLPKEDRGLAMALFTAGPLFGPVLGPIIGGFATQYLNWRWTFYLILIIAAVVTIASFIFMRETSATILLKRKTARLARETGNSKLRAAGDNQIPLLHLIAHTVIRPVKFLVTSPILCLIALYIAFNFGVTMLLFATFPTVFEDIYNWSVGISGLSYIGIGVGCAIGVFIFAKFSDRLLRANSGEYRAERRLILMMFVSPLLPIALFLYAWTTQYKVHWVVPIISTAIGGPCVVVVTSSSQTYIIDIFGPQTAASAMASINLLRNLLGAFLPLAAPSLYANLGMGWGNSVLAFITMLFIPIPFLFYRYGARLREKFPVRV